MCAYLVTKVINSTALAMYVPSSTNILLILIVLVILQVFFCGGRLVFGPDARSILFTILLITAPVVVFCVFVGHKFFDDFPHHRGVSILAVAIGLNVLVSSSSF